MKSMHIALAAALALGFATFTTVSYAHDLTQAAQGRHGSVQVQTPSHADTGSEIHGRPDWNVDYTSQLAPQVLRSAVTVATVQASAATQDVAGH